jgi:small nuclear ribonucleoprotein (snRNP)-like protein
MAVTSASTNKILLKELQKLKFALANYDQYIYMHVEKAMEYIQKTPMTENAKKRRDIQNESLIRTFIKPKEISTY